MTTAAVDGYQGNVYRSISPHVRLLPYLDRGPLYDQIDLNEDEVNRHGVPPTSSRNESMLTQQVPVFVCPSDNVTVGSTNYRANFGVGPAERSWSRKPNTSGAFLLGRGLAASSFDDGLSNTAFFSEKLVGDGNQEQYTPWRDFAEIEFPMKTLDDVDALCRVPAGTEPDHDSWGGSSWLFGGYRQTWYNHVFGPNSKRADCAHGSVDGGRGAHTARSFHAGGVNVCMGDESVRFVNENIDLNVWRALATRKGGDSIGDF